MLLANLDKRNICSHIIKFITIEQQNTNQKFNLIGGVMVSMFTSSAVDDKFLPLMSQTKDHEIGICCFYAKHAAFMSKIKDQFPQTRDNMCEWKDTSTC